MSNFEHNDSRTDLRRYVALAEQAEPGLFGREQRATLDILQAEHNNLLNALDEAYRTDPSAGIRIGIAIWRFWLLRGYLVEGRARLTRLLNGKAEIPLQIKVRGMTVLGIIAFFHGDYVLAEQCAQHSLALAMQVEEAWSVAFSNTVLGWSAQARGDYVRAEALFQQSLTLFRRIGHRWGEAVSLLNLGEVARSQGDMGTAEQFYRQDLAIYRELEEQSAIAATLCNLGYVTLRRADLSAARKYFSEAILLCQRLGNRQFAAGAFIGLAGVVASEGDGERAAKLLGVADTLLVQIQGSLEPADVIEHDRILEMARVKLGEDKFTAVWHEGKILGMDEAIVFALEEF